MQIIFPGLTTFENVRIAKQAQRGGSFKIFSSKEGLVEVNEETWAILERLDLQKMANVKSENLSHGHQRLLEIALAMAGDAKILFLDEPTAGMSVVLVEHDMDVVMTVSDEITVLNQGKIIAEGPPEEIQLNEKVKEAYLGTE